jgi:hypothetical protein
MKTGSRLSLGVHAALAYLAVLALLLAVPQFKAALPLPERLSDEAFWKMIEDFSEDGGSFTSENFSSNERGYETLIPKLAAKLDQGGVYLGVGPEQNFQYIASLKPKMAFIIDIRRQNMIQHLMYKAAFEMAADRVEFLSIVFSRRRPPLSADIGEVTTSQLFSAYVVQPKDDDFAEENRKAIKSHLADRHGFKLTPEDERTLDHVFDVFAAYGPYINYSSNIDGLGRIVQNRGGNNVNYADLMVLVDGTGVNRSYLASEESFRFMKDLQSRNLLVPVVGNFGGPKAIRAVGQYIREQGATVNVFYLSNVEQYLFNPPQGGPQIFREFYENVATLPLHERSTFIRSGNPFGGRGGGLTPMMSSVRDVLDAFRAGRITSQRDVLLLSAN